MGKDLEIKGFNNLATVLNNSYKAMVTNYLGDEKKSARFLTSVMGAVRKTPKLLECDQQSVITAFLTMAELKLMPSDVSGEAYVLPYKNKAQFQLGYQGLVTLFDRAGTSVKSAEIVYKNDKFSYKNGAVNHEPDVFSENRGKAIGAYVILINHRNVEVSKVMSEKEILNIGKKFSKSYYEYDFKTKKQTDKIGKYTPWNEKNDPELWMWKKTVLKQLAKLVSKNEDIYKAISEDNKESNINQRLEKASEESQKLKMVNLKQDE